MTKPICAGVGIGPQNGASFARRFASEGYAIALLSRKTEYSSKLAAEIAFQFLRNRWAVPLLDFYYR